MDDQTTYVGIDLGTTNSLIASVGASGTPEILTNRGQEPITPSVVGLRPGKNRDDSRPQFLVGRQALNNAERDPKNTIRSIKRFMGLQFSDPRVEVARSHVSYEVQESPSEKGKLVVRLGQDLLTPEEVSALILRQLRSDAEARLANASFSHVVITVPAYFGDAERKATWNAGLRAGLRVKVLVDEPTAAYLYESRDSQRTRERILVFDFGGGTLDISLIQRKESNFQVVSYTGDNFLGGDDVDRLIVAHLKYLIREEGGELPDHDLRSNYILKQHAENAKRAICSGSGSAFVTIPGFCKTKDGELFDVDVEVTQEDFEAQLEQIIERISELLESYLAREGYSPEHFDEILMVGGSSAIPQVQELLRSIFERDGKTRVRLAKKPMEAVALGAAIYSKMIRGVVCPGCKHENGIEAEKCEKCGADLSMGAFGFDGDGEKGGGSVQARLPWSLGVRYRRTQTDSDAFRVLLEKGSIYPTSNKSSFRIPRAEGFNIEVYEGEDLQAVNNRIVCVIRVTRDTIPPDVNEDDPIDVEFTYGRNRTLMISVTYPTSRSNYNPRWKVEAPKEMPAENKVKNLTSLLPQARRFLEDYRDFIDKGGRKKFEADLAAAESAVMQGDREECERLTENIMMAMFHGTGIASTLFLAERTKASDDPNLGQTIRTGALELREKVRNGDPDTEASRKKLEMLIMEVMSKLSGRSSATGEYSDSAPLIKD